MLQIYIFIYVQQKQNKKMVHISHSKEQHNIQSFPLRYLVLFDLFMARICFTIERVNKPFELIHLPF